MWKKTNRSAARISCTVSVQRPCYRYIDRTISPLPKPLAIFCCWKVRFVSGLIGNPKDRSSHEMAHIKTAPRGAIKGLQLFPIPLFLHFFDTVMQQCSHLSRITRKPVYGVSDQVLHKPDYTTTEDSKRLKIAD